MPEAVALAVGLSAAKVNHVWLVVPVIVIARAAGARSPDINHIWIVVALAQAVATG